VFGAAWKNGHWRVKHWAQQIQTAKRNRVDSQGDNHEQAGRNL
jgi:hypothetical protein